MHKLHTRVYIALMNDMEHANSICKHVVMVENKTKSKQDPKFGLSTPYTSIIPHCPPTAVSLSRWWLGCRCLQVDWPLFTKQTCFAPLTKGWKMSSSVSTQSLWLRHNYFPRVKCHTASNPSESGLISLFCINL